MATDVPERIPDAEASEGGIPLWLILVAALGLMACGLLVASAICGPLYLIVFPPGPPHYPGATKIESHHTAHGVDSWRYRSADDVCDVYAMYQAEADYCHPVRTFCDVARKPPRDGSGFRTMTACYGTGKAGMFSWEWKAVLYEFYAEDGSPYTEFELSRTVYWGTGGG